MKMKRFSIITAVALIAVVALIAQVQTAGATKAIGNQEGMECTSCHDKPGSKLMTDQGKYYELMGSLDGYDQLETDFGKCTTCHVRKPGSDKLTKTGKKYQSLTEDMDGLKDWLMEPHPTPDLTEDSD
jgi:hypothetical protein